MAGLVIRFIHRGWTWLAACRQDRGLPLATVGLVAAHVIIQVFTPGDVRDRLLQLPLEALELSGVLRTASLGMLFHLDAAHLCRNMLFLLICGAMLEPIAGIRRLLAAYGAGGIVASLVCINLALGQVRLPADPGLVLHYPALGATGAIAGLIGLRLRWPSRGRSVLPQPKRRRIPCGISGAMAVMLLIGLFLSDDPAGYSAWPADRLLPGPFWGFLGGLLGGVLLSLVCDRPAEATVRSCPTVRARIGSRSSTRVTPSAGSAGALWLHHPLGQEGPADFHVELLAPDDHAVEGLRVGAGRQGV